MKKFYFILFFFTAIGASFSQTVMTPKEVFYYTFRVNNISPYDGRYFDRQYKYWDFYAFYLDRANYISSVQDEFKRPSYVTRIANEINSGVRFINFQKEFFIEVSLPVSSYDFDCECFKLNRYDFLKRNFSLLQINEIGSTKFAMGKPVLNFHIGNFFNFNDFDFQLRINSSDAERFVNSRKDNTGSVNRSIRLKVIFNVVDLPFKITDIYNLYLGVYVRKIEYYDGVRLLGSSLPKKDYFDKVKLLSVQDSIIGTKSEGLFRFRWNGKYGFVNDIGKVVIQPNYDYAEDFSEGLSCVSLNKKWGFINSTGNVVLPFKYYSANSFVEGRSRVITEFGVDNLGFPKGKYGFINNSGKLIIPTKYFLAYDFSEGLAIARKDIMGESGFIDRNGNEIVPFKFENALPFKEDLAAISIKGKWGFIDKRGNEVIPLKYQWALSFSDGLAGVKLDDKWGYLDRNGNEIIPFIFTNANSFINSKAYVTMDGRSFYIDKLANILE